MTDALSCRMHGRSLIAMVDAAARMTMSRSSFRSHRDANETRGLSGAVTRLAASIRVSRPAASSGQPQPGQLMARMAVRRVRQHRSASAGCLAVAHPVPPRPIVGAHRPPWLRHPVRQQRRHRSQAGRIVYIAVQTVRKSSGGVRARVIFTSIQAPME